MILRRIIAACALLCALVSGAHAQTGRVLTPTQLNAEIFMLFGDNTTGAITPFALRQVQLDLVASLSPGAAAEPLTIGPDTNVTATLSGTPATALLQSVEINFGWTGQLAVSRGGTGQASFTSSLPLIGNGAGALVQGARSGNTTTFGTTNGTLTSGDCLQADANGNIVDNGSTCGAGSNTAATQNFVAGVGFTPGTTTGLTLSSSPTNANELLIAFDGVVQSHNTWSLAGAVITFSVAIPQNVNVVEAQWTTASTTAGVGSLTDSAANVATGAVTMAPPWAVTAGNTIGPGGACFVKSRTAAVLLNLTLCNVVQTGGYANPGDGGGAVFKPAGSTPFQDSFVAVGTGAGFINQAGTGCTNGTYNGVYLGGGTGQGLIGIIVVSGGSVTSVTITTAAPGYTIGDQLNQNGLFTCSGNAFNWQVTSLSTPSASFTDAASNRWQYVVDQGNYPNIMQFGAKCNWTKAAGDAGSTDDTVAIQNTFNYAYGGGGKSVPTLLGAGGTQGMKVVLPSAGYCLTSNLTVPLGVWVMGPGPWSGNLKAADSLGSSTNYITICDITTGSSCFGSGMQDINIFPGSGAASAGEYMIVSNNIQQSTFLKRMTVAGGNRGSINLETGFGGAAMIGMSEIEAGSGTTATPSIRMNYSTAVANLDAVIIEDGGSFCAHPVGCTGLLIASGYIKVNGFHSEGIDLPINIFTTSQGLGRYTNLTCGAGSSACVTVQVSATAGLNVVGSALGTTATLNCRGVSTTGNINTDVGC